MKKIESLKIYGRRWYQKSCGNTYHTARVIANGEELKSGIKYGYENHYLQTDAELLRENGYDIPEGNAAAYALMCKYPHKAVDVDRKRDL